MPGVIVLDTKLKMYYRKKIFGGRSLVARVIDFVVLRLLMFLILLVLFFYAFRSLTVALLLSVFITSASSINFIHSQTKKSRKIHAKRYAAIKKEMPS